MIKFLPWIAAILLIPSVLLNIFLVYKQNTVDSHQVLRVIDGDTFETTDHKVIRLLGVRAPEIDVCGGKEAKAELEKIILGKDVHFVVPVVDAYNRLVADVYLSDKTSVNVLIIKSGWAAYQSSDSNDKESEKKAGEESRLAKVGIYSGACTETTNTTNAKCSIKGNFNDSTGTKIYSSTSCVGYDDTIINLAQGDKWFCSAKEAEAAGFTESQNCHRKN